MNSPSFLSGLLGCALAALVGACVPALTEAPTVTTLADCSQTRDIERAVTACSHAIRLRPKDAQLRLNRGFALFLKKYYAAALGDLDEATRVAPKDPGAFARRGIVFRATGDDDLAIADFTNALELGSGDLNVYVDRGMAHFTKGETEQAIADYTTAIERDADKTFVGQLAHVARGLAWMYSGAPDKAQVDLSRAVELNPREPFFALFLHLAEMRMNPATTRSSTHLASAVGTLDMTKWPGPVIRMFLGEGAPEALLEVKRGEVATCEADYFVAEFMQFEHKTEEALRLYRKAQGDCERYILERVAAGAALRSLGVTP